MGFLTSKAFSFLAFVFTLRSAVAQGPVSIHHSYPTAMHPDAGAIIGISLAGSVLLVAILILCILHLPCCQMKLKSRRPARMRPRTSSSAPITSFGLGESSRDIRELSALDLHAQNQTHFAGIINPLWAMPYGSCDPLPSHHHHHQCQCPISSNASCHGWHSVQRVASHQSLASRSPGASGSILNFEYMAPQLLSPSDSPPPPYTDTFNDNINTDTEDTNRRYSLHQPNPPPYSPPKHPVDEQSCSRNF